MKNIPEVQAVRDRMITGPLGDIKGQLKAVRRGEKFIVMEFEDGRWAVFEAVSDYDNELEINYIRDNREPEIWTLHSLGLVTREMWDKQSELDAERQRQRVEAHEEEIYQKVKARKDGLLGKSSTGTG